MLGEVVYLSLETGGDEELSSLELILFLQFILGWGDIELCFRFNAIFISKKIDALRTKQIIII